MCRRLLALSLLLVVAFLATGSGRGQGPGPVQSTTPGHAPAQQPPAAADEKEILQLGHWGARVALGKCLLPLDAVVVATAATPGAAKAVVAGTVTTPGQGQPPQYDKLPPDRLVWKRPGQPAVVFFIDKMAGDLGNGGKNFLAGAHSLKYRVVVQGELDLEAISERTATGAFTSRHETRLKGTVLHAGKQYKIDLVQAGKSYFESSFGGSEYRDDQTLTGTIAGADVQLGVDEAAHFTAVVHEGASVTFDWRKLNNKVAAGGKVYQWDNVLLRKNFKNGKVSGADRDWVCQGKVLRDGQAFASYGKEWIGAHMVYKIETPAGAIEVGRW
jgi:hypothetical protein